MKAVFTLLILLAPGICRAQLALFSFDGTNETSVASTFNYGNVADGATDAVRFRAFNQGNPPILLSSVTAAGSGFAITAVNGSVPGTIASGSFLEFTVSFTAGTVASYSASLLLTSSTISGGVSTPNSPISVILLAASIPAPVITISAALGGVQGCSADAVTGGFDFPPAAMGTTAKCTFSLQNPNPQALAISVAVTGNPAFQGPQNVPSLAAGQTTTFVVQVTPVCGTLYYTGLLTVNGQSFALNATGLTPPLPTPSIAFDTTTFASGQQHTLTITLPTAAVCAVTGGYVNLAFTPASATGKSDDASVMFLAGSVRKLPISVAANSTQVLISTQPSTMFQTGTTAGAITFAISGVSVGGNAAATITIPPAPVFIDSANASNQILGQLDIEVIGYDNTYSAGSMSFTFFDSTGKVIGTAVSANFTSNFASYFATPSVVGSTFLMRVSFPVEGVQTQVVTVQMTLTNSAGQAQTGTLTFQ